MKPCLILPDLMMPVMTGPEFLEELRRDPRLASTPVLVLSAWPKEAAQVASVQGWIKKPFDLDTLLDSIRARCSDAPSRRRDGD
jgi:CheY-like chemotaxis protein